MRRKSHARFLKGKAGETPQTYLESDKTLFQRSLTYCHPALIFFNLRSIPGSYHRTLGWTGCGYHYVIPIEDTIEPARPEDITGAHCRSHNSHSIGICYIGGLAADGRTPEDTRTKAQKSALRHLLESLHKSYPKALIVGHSDLDPKKPHCPGFDVVSEYRDLQPPI